MTPAEREARAVRLLRAAWSADASLDFGGACLAVADKRYTEQSRDNARPTALRLWSVALDALGDLLADAGEAVGLCRPNPGIGEIDRELYRDSVLLRWRRIAGESTRHPRLLHEAETAAQTARELLEGLAALDNESPGRPGPDAPM